MYLFAKPCLLKNLLFPLFISTLLCFAFINTSYAAEESSKKEQKTKKTESISQKVFKKLQEAQEQVEAKNYVAAHVALKKIRESSRLTNYERAQIWNYTAYTYYLQEKYKDAIGGYKKVLEQEELPSALKLSVLKTLSQLHFVVADYDSALITIKQLISDTDEPGADLYLLLGQAHFQKEDYQSALAPMRTAIKLYEEQGKRPKENWLLILRVIHYELEDYEKMVVVLRKLIRLYPKDTYMMTLAAAYSQLGETKKQLAIMEVLYEKGFITEPKQKVNLANLFLLHGLPYKAAKVLEKEFEVGSIEESEKNLRLLSQAWQQARYDEKAIPPLEKAASLSENGDLYIRLAQLHINLGDWNESGKAIKKGLSKGGLKRPDTAHIMLGMSLFNQKKFTSARTSFQKASKYEKSKSVAKQWIAHITDELKRQELLKQEVTV